MQKTNAQPTNHDLRVFALILSIGFSVLGVLIPYLKGHSFNFSLITLAGLIFLVGMAMPKLIIKPRKYWIIIGNNLGKINGAILFTVLYFVLFSTIGLIFRIFSRDRMKSQFRKIESTMVMKNEISTFEDPF